ncbi:uncharacterized protein [Anoplolepis gracilipes]|uniref:uncharacterized protein isoform X2 n=1 Tax=Anoplolepis gracilipes TaxID=354296 RepID=UPI003B9DCBB9
MATLTSLPDKMIIIILENKNLNIKDIVNFMSTCKKFQNIKRNNKLWKKKFYQSCPSLRIKSTKMQKNFPNIDFKMQIKKGMKCTKELQYYVSLMSNNNLSNTKAKKLDALLSSAAIDPIIYYFVMDNIKKNAQLLRQIDCDLTNIYNFGIIFRCLKQYRLKHKLNKFRSKPEKKQLLERLLTIVAQYFQPHVSYSVIKIWLDNIVQQVLCILKSKYPSHSIFSMSAEKEFAFQHTWKENNINENFWNQTEAKQIIEILKQFIFSELECCKLRLLWTMLKIEDKHTCTLYISKCFRKFLLTIMYHSLARRFGIHCELVPLCHPYLQITWKPSDNDLKNAEYFFVNDVSRLNYPNNIVEGRFYDALTPDTEDTYAWITGWMLINFNEELVCRNIIDCSWELNILEKMINNYVINITRPIKIKSDIEIKGQQKRRNKKIKFAVGIIVTHSSHLYSPSRIKSNRHNGVIIGWHFKCDVLFIRRSLSSIVPHLSECCGHHHICIGEECVHVSNQPHYIILTENNVVCYVRQDDISICSPQWIDNVEIGQFFSRFEGTHYVPNNSLAKDYPYDTSVIPEILSNSIQNVP